MLGENATLQHDKNELERKLVEVLIIDNVKKVVDNETTPYRPNQILL